MTLKSAPISPAPLPASRSLRGLDAGGLGGPGAPYQRLRPLLEAERLEKIALVDRPVDGGAGGAGAARHRGEIDMGGDVDFAGIGQRIDHAMRAQGLQRLAKSGRRMAVVDEQSRPALSRQTSADLEHQAVTDRADLEHLAFVRLRRDEPFGLGGEAESQLAGAVEADQPFMPAARAAHILPDRQRIEEFIGDQDGGAVRRLAEPRRPGDRRARRQQRIVLDRRQGRARVDEPDVERGAEFRRDARGAQRIAHQRAAARSEFDQAQGFGRAHRRPDFRRP